MSSTWAPADPDAAAKAMVPANCRDDPVDQEPVTVTSPPLAALAEWPGRLELAWREIWSIR